MIVLGPFFVALVVGALFFCVVQAFVELIRRQVDRNHPNVEAEAELEAVLAHVLSKELRS